ncbi:MULTISPECIES: hypothetical protein [unclassified Paenibacillus]|uniref:DUF6199 family natural product biosynthesis protein n=1 Tax=unclassified Paenibacillus TaxID=185978 RepID=UPI0024052CCB|nr:MULTISPECIES: hypothetical protein [unclassified Paenibacillus]MDF9839248.1 hypothetical protein [Paenibacillus sp. PastF-2]MDF9845829.1 hypothetical protein [Paenibacillus sp. PastM-2]MDF9852402.1 hypothetical protein [Paenibacillus sp. PastF-1]MDH6477868.1 hypothetical protein [Paenibacillus sp. PastH-2]MDH6505607.1 hypothetical protein [Paenibacillus sp. PastM-3]
MALGIILLIFGIGSIVFGLYIRKHPDYAWKMSEAWKVKGDSEPSSSYISLMTFRGTVGISIGALFILFGLLQFL